MAKIYNFNAVTPKDKSIIETLISMNEDNYEALLHFGSDLHMSGVKRGYSAGYKAGCRDYFIGELIGFGLVAGVIFVAHKWNQKKAAEISKETVNEQEEN